MKIDTNHIDTLAFSTLPEDAGQIVEISYAADWENELLYRRTTDRADGATTLAVAIIVCGDFAPQNNALPEVGQWTQIG